MIYIKLDLHIHTHYSDGLFEPTKVIELAIENGLNGIAITDHDTISGIEEAKNYINSKYREDFILIPGIEFGCIHGEEEVHILGYFIDYNNKSLLELIDKLKLSRINRSKKIIKKLNDLGISISFEEVSNETKDNLVGRPHIARVLIKKGYVKDIPSAFKEYIGVGKPAYVERFKLSVGDAIDLIHDIGGISVLAHPGLLEDRSNIQECIDLGIDGIECIHSEHSHEESKYFKKICMDNDLKITGGSDCHGQYKKGELLLGNYYIELDDIDTLKESK